MASAADTFQTTDVHGPGLGSPNAPQSSSVYVLDVSTAGERLSAREIVKTGPRRRARRTAIDVYSGSHPNSVVVGREAIYVANGNNDSISVLDPRTYEERDRIALSPLRGRDRMLSGVQPVGLALSPDGGDLYVAEAGINAVGVIRLTGGAGADRAHSDRLVAERRAASAPTARRSTSPTRAAAGPRPISSAKPFAQVHGARHREHHPDASEHRLDAYTDRVYANNGFVEARDDASTDRDNPIPSQARKAERSDQARDLHQQGECDARSDLGDITRRAAGAGERRAGFSLGVDASPNHHELALRFAFSDNFFLEPSVSSDGHRWLTGQYTAEIEETHWPASYGGKRNDSGDDPEVFKNFPGRIGFTDANASPEPNDYNEHGGIYLHLNRHGKSFVNFGNGYEFAVIDEPGGAEPTGAREHVNVPMEKVVRDNSDHLYPTYNTHIPDAPLPEDPTRFNRFGRFKQVFESRYVDRRRNVASCRSTWISTIRTITAAARATSTRTGPDWSFRRFVQDNDAALGLTVELISNSPCWKDTVIFVVEDDTQNGADHVDGHRSIFLAIGPWVKKEYVSKTHTSLASIFKTVNLILGLPPLNQYDAAATDLRDMFTGTPDFSAVHLPERPVRRRRQRDVAAGSGRGIPSDFMIAATSLVSSTSGRLKSTPARAPATSRSRRRRTGPSGRCRA